MAKPARRSSRTVTLKIPSELFRSLSKLIEGTGFRSVTEFAVYVLRDVAAGGNLNRGSKSPAAGRPSTVDAGLTDAEIEAVRRRLRALGYIE